VRWDEAATVADNVRKKLPEFVCTFFRQGRKAAFEGAADAALHRFRLNVKAFRYTLESFEPCYGPGLERRLSRLRQLQDHLGAIADCTAAWRLVEAVLPAGDAGRERLKKGLERRRRRMVSQFRRFWSLEFDAPGEERLWAQYLARPRTGRRPPL
jgi:CHAD domain-containing protein